MTLDYPKLLNQTLKYLGLRPRSSAEIKTYLHKKTEDPELISKIMDKLVQSKFIDDVEFTNWYIESRSRSRPRSSRLLQLELKRKGINVVPQVDDLKLAKLALTKKKTLKNRDQAIRFLASRGFSWGIIETALKKEYNIDYVT